VSDESSVLSCRGVIEYIPIQDSKGREKSSDEPRGKGVLDARMEICLSFMLKRRPTASPSTAWKDPNSTTPSPSLGGFRKALNSVVSTKDAGGFGPKRGESLIATIGAPGESEEPLYTSELVSAAAISAEEGDSAVASPASVCLHFSLHACLDAQQSKAVSICLWQTNAKHGQRSLDAGRRLLLSRAVLQLHEICLLGGRQHVVMPMSVTDRLCLFDVDAIVWRLPPLALGGGALSLEQGDSSGVAHNVHSPFNPMSDTFTFARMGASSHKSTPAAPMDLLSGIDIFTGPASPNPSSQYSDLDLVVIQDICVEPKSTVQLPLQLLSNLQISLKAAADAWARRLQVEKARQGFFPTDKAAIEAGRVIVHAYVAGARGLRDVVGSRNDDSSAEEQCSSPQSPTTPPLQDASPDARDQSGSGSAGSRNRKIFSDVKKFGGRAVAIARNATQANVKASVLGHGDRQLKRSNFFVVVSQGGRPRSRTNTEYCTNSPEWGSNENKSACLHNTPKLLPSVIGPGILELASGPNVPDGAVGCRFYVPQSDVAQGTVQLDLYQEVYTLRGGIREERIGSACAPLQGIASNPPTHPLDLWLPVTPSKPWPPLPTFEPPVTPAIHVQLSLQHDYDATLGEESRLTGTMEADPLSGADSESDESSDSEGEERQHDDVQALPELTLAANLASQPASVTRAQCYEWMTVLSQPDDVLDIALLRSLYDSVEFPVPFCHSHAQAMARSHARVARMCSVLWQMQRQGKQFRSSLDKKHRDLQCIPTNLHVQLMVVDDGVQASPSVYDFITVGAPTAHALGYKKGGLLSLASAQSVLKQNIISLKQQQPLDEAALVQLSMQLEMSSLTLALRRAVVTSQVLGIAAAAFATKLELMSHGLLEGAVTAVRGWLAVGFIIGFEGLLSTQVGIFGSVLLVFWVVYVYKQRIFTLPTSGKGAWNGGGYCSLPGNSAILLFSPGGLGCGIQLF
jgi:hypothetical protein